MQLKYSKTIRKNIVTVNLEVASFTKREALALQFFEAPTITVDKMYPLHSDNPKYPVNFTKKLKLSGFRVRAKFDGTEDYEGALEAAESFYEDIREILEDSIWKLAEMLDDSFAYDLGTGFDNISTGIEKPIPPMNKPSCDLPNYHVTKPSQRPKPGSPTCPPPCPPHHHYPQPPVHIVNCDCDCEDDTEVVWRDGASLMFTESNSTNTIHN